MSASGEEKKIIIDEDWKSRVEAEKAAAAERPDAEKSPAAQPGAAQPATEKAPASPPLPPADLMFLAGTLYMQALLGLGLLPHPVTKKAEVSLPHAKHGIDCLDVLQTKTHGNRTPEESQALENMLHELRMAYLAAVEKQP